MKKVNCFTFDELPKKLQKDIEEEYLDDNWDHEREKLIDEEHEGRDPDDVWRDELRNDYLYLADGTRLDKNGVPVEILDDDDGEDDEDEEDE